VEEAGDDERGERKTSGGEQARHSLDVSAASRERLISRSMLTHMHWADWLVVAMYVVFAITVGIKLTKKAEADVDQFFLSGRSLPWWVAGTSMVATTFAADTPLVITGWVRDHGIWQNWLWWTLAVSGMLGVFLFSRYWRRGGIMTKAELAELRYGGREAAVLRGALGFFHAAISNTIVLCWVLLAASKIIDVLFDLGGDESAKAWGLTAACAIALTYSLLAGFWGVVLTDLVQFAMAMSGAIALAVLSWNAVGGGDAIVHASQLGELIRPETLRFIPPWGDGGVFDAAFWTGPFTIFAVYLGVYWWASEGIDGSGVSVQRILASKDDRHGMLASLWYNVAHYAFRPWPWICVALASMLVFPHREVVAEFDGSVASIDGNAIQVVDASGATHEYPLAVEGDYDGWRMDDRVAVDKPFQEGDVLAATDSERAYVWMMVRYLGPGLLGLVVASLLAAFMSTIDTHVNLASSFFVNDIYRRFLVRKREAKHYVRVAQVASIGVMAIGGLLAYGADSISDLFQFFLSVLAGVGPIYVLRWLWWRVRASAEITAMVTSLITTVAVTLLRGHVTLVDGPLSPDGVLSDVGRHLLVTAVSMVSAFVAIAVTPRPDPASLVAFYRRVRPMGAWGPVRDLCPDVERPREGAPIAVGVICGLCSVYGPMLGVGWFLLGRRAEAAIAGLVMLAGIVGVRWSLSRLSSIPSEPREV